MKTCPLEKYKDKVWFKLILHVPMRFHGKTTTAKEILSTGITENALLACKNNPIMSDLVSSMGACKM